MENIIKHAVTEAGGPVAVAYHFKFSSDMAVKRWIKKRKVPNYHAQKLAELCGNKVTAEQIMEYSANRAES